MWRAASDTPESIVDPNAKSDELQDITYDTASTYKDSGSYAKGTIAVSGVALDGTSFESLEIADGVGAVSYTHLPGADVYQVLRKEDGGDWQVLTSTVRRTVFTDTTAGKSRKYYYTVRAVNGDVISKTYTTSRWIICR